MTYHFSLEKDQTELVIGEDADKLEFGVENGEQKKIEVTHGDN